LDEILFVVHAPCCSPGAILALGSDIAGPGGSEGNELEPSLVLATSFSLWLEHLEQMGWIEYGLVPGALAELPRSQEQALRLYYKTLNPQITWGPT
jgi:hypothetical protein